MSQITMRILFTTLLFSAISIHAAEPSAEYLRNWLICGPIQMQGPDPNEPDDRHFVGFDENYLAAQGAEGEVRPKAGDKVTYSGGEVVWKAFQSTEDSVDLDALVDPIDGKLAYAYTEFEADAVAAVLALGSDDGCRVWLNGRQIFDHAIGRGLVLDVDLIPVMLQQGTNRLLIKVEDQFDAWALACRFLTLDNGPASQRLRLFEIQQEGSTPATLNFMANPWLLDTFVTSAEVTVARRRSGGEVLWKGPWTGEARMPLSLDTSAYGEYVVTVEASFAGGGAQAFQEEFSVGTPIAYTLFADGMSDYVIVLDDNASEAEKWSAGELQRWLASIGRATLPVLNVEAGNGKPAIVLGWNDRTRAMAGEGAKAPNSADESFTYFNQGRDIAIFGGSQRGTMYGVMAFLENELGVRFYTPAVTVTPSKDRYTFRQLHFSDAPGIQVRNDFYFEAFDPTWAARNRVNGAMNNRTQPGGVESYGAVHTFFPLLPPAEFFDTHPEYYSLINGKRQSELGQLCLTNAEVLSIVTERLRQRMRDNPGDLVYSVSQNDWFNPCQCDACQAIALREESESGPVLHFVNQVAEGIAQEFPDKFVGTLAYQYTRKPPKFLRPRDNVVIRLCSIECCFAHDFGSCPKNATFLKDLAGWAEIAPRIYIWDYVVSFSNYVLPFPNFSVLQPNIQTLGANKVIGIMEQAAYQSRGGEFAELKAYLIAKLLWNPEVEVDAVIDDFMFGYYERAGRPMRAYFDLVQGLVGPDTHFTIWIQPDNPLYTREFMAAGEALLDEAERVADTPEILARVELARLPLLFLKCNQAPRQALRDGSFDRLLAIKEREGVSHFSEAADEVWNRFMTKMDHARME